MLRLRGLIVWADPPFFHAPVEMMTGRIAVRIETEPQYGHEELPNTNRFDLGGRAVSGPRGAPISGRFISFFN